jgi:iron complex outermembrane recepter protein
MKINQYQPLCTILFSLAAGCAGATDYSSEQEYLQEFPVVISASRLIQPLSEAPNAMTVIDRKMIVASGFRSLPDLFKLVPGMYVSYYKGSQPIISYHGATDQYSRRMQIMIDGRSVYLPPNNMVDWSNLPITIEDIERIEVIRGPAAASYGANSTQGVINILTRDAGMTEGHRLTVTRGNKGINDQTAHYGANGEVFDYRVTLGYTADNGYDDLHTTPENKAIFNQLLNNSNDSNQARLVNFRGNYHPSSTDSIDLLFGFNHDVQGVGFMDKNPTPNNPTSTNGDMFHDLIANASFSQIGWTRLLGNASELHVLYYHVQENQHEYFPAYLRGVYFAGPLVQTLTTSRDQLEVQHTLKTSESNRLIYGVNYQKNSVVGQSLIPPLAFANHYASDSDDFQVYSNDEWRISPKFLLNTGGMFERDGNGHEDFSPRISLSFHLTPQDTLRTGISVAYRTPALIEMSFPPVQPGALIIPSSTVLSPGLAPEKLVSHEIAYIGEFPALSATLDLRLFDDRLSNGIIPDTKTGTFANRLSTAYHGFEATLKKSWDKTSNLTFNYARDWASSNGPDLAAAGIRFAKPANPLLYNDIIAASIPKNSASLLYTQFLNSEYSFSTAYYYQSALQPTDRGILDSQPAQHRTDVRVARQFQVDGSMRGEVALVVQNLFNKDYTEYIASNLFNQRCYLKMTFRW